MPGNKSKIISKEREKKRGSIFCPYFFIKEVVFYFQTLDKFNCKNYIARYKRNKYEGELEKL